MHFLVTPRRIGSELRLVAMATISDPLGLWTSSDSWSGTEQDDILAYKQGSDVIDGKGGYDTLLIPFSQSSATVGAYANNSTAVAIRYRYYEGIYPDIGWTTMTVSALNIEQIQFLDGVVTLQEKPVAPTPVVAPQTPPPANTTSVPQGPIESEPLGGIQLAAGLGTPNTLRETYVPGVTQLVIDTRLFPLRGQTPRVKTVRNVKAYQKAVKRNRHDFIYSSYSGVLSFDSNPSSRGFGSMDQLVEFVNQPSSLPRDIFSLS